MNIVVAIKEGDEAVFQQVFEQYSARLYSFIFKKTGSDYLSEEAVQETFIKLWHYRATLNETLPISVQLFRIARTTLIDAIRKQNNLLAAFAKLPQPQVQSLTWDKVSYNDLNQQLKQHIAAMPPMRRKVFLLSRVEELSHKEIAALLAISTKTVEKHIAEALKQLRPHLAKINFMLLLLNTFV